jgi:hypothetical protein
MDTSAEVFSLQIYSNYPVLDSVLIYYLDIESIVARHQVNPEAFESRGSLYVLLGVTPCPVRNRHESY